MVNANTNSPRKYDFIDTLRGLAILAVILIHTGQIIPPSTQLLKTITDDGAQGVQLFFIASAMTLFLSLKSRKDNESSPTRNFFIRRFFRIAPMYWVAVIFFALLDGLSPRYFAPSGIQWWYPLLTASFLNGWHPETINSVVPGGWSIAVEMTFYLLVPFLFLHLKDVKSTLFFIVFTLILGYLLNTLMQQIFTPLYPQKYHYMVDSFTFFWFFDQLPIFGIGILAFQLFERFKKIGDRSLGYVLLGTAIFLEWAFIITHTYNELIPHHFMMAIGFGFLVFGLYFSQTRILINPVTIWIGRISFSVYLVHFAVLRLVEAEFPNGFPIHGTLGTAIGYFIIAGISIIISVATYNFIEKPGIALGKAIIERLESAHGLAAQPTREG